MPRPSTPSELIAQETPSGLSVPGQALWWLKKGGLAIGPEWKKAHELCQQNEGDAAHDLVHALAHWIEGDMGNAGYWYRRVGGTRAPTIAQEWERIAAKLLAQGRRAAR
jgi:hypothetical protein